MSSSITIWHKTCCQIAVSFKIELENSFTWALNKKLVMLMSNSDKLALLYVAMLYSLKKQTKNPTQTTPPLQQSRQSVVERNSWVKENVCITMSGILVFRHKGGNTKLISTYYLKTLFKRYAGLCVSSKFEMSESVDWSSCCWDFLTCVQCILGEGGDGVTSN